MSALLHYLLIAHVRFGLVGIIALYAVWMILLKRNVPIRALKIAAVTGFVSIVLSWFTGGYYYVAYYGTSVKPIILKGVYPWAHTVFIEAKEHVFLFLPFLAIVLALAAFLPAEGFAANPRLKKSLSALAGVSTVLGIIITLSGVIISGAVR